MPDNENPAQADPNAMDPMTKLAADFQAMKERLDAVERDKADANKQLNAVLNTNKNLVAELGRAKQQQPQQPQQQPDAEKIALNAFYKTMGIKQGE